MSLRCHSPPKLPPPPPLLLLLLPLRWSWSCKIWGGGLAAKEGKGLGKVCEDRGGGTAGIRVQSGAVGIDFYAERVSKASDTYELIHGCPNYKGRRKGGIAVDYTRTTRRAPMTSLHEREG